MKIKQIKWRDSNIYLTQCSVDEDFKIAIVTSIGFVVSEDKEKIVVAGDIIGKDIRRVIVIPKENIV